MAKQFPELRNNGSKKAEAIDELLGQVQEEQPKPYYAAQVKIKETRSKRLQLLVTPSLYERIEREAIRLQEETAKAQGRKVEKNNKRDGKVNELINQILDNVLPE